MVGGLMNSALNNPTTWEEHKREFQYSDEQKPSWVGKGKEGIAATEVPVKVKQAGSAAGSGAAAGAGAGMPTPNSVKPTSIGVKARENRRHQLQQQLLQLLMQLLMGNSFHFPVNRRP
jgi:hypothetical protein